MSIQDSIGLSEGLHVLDSSHIRQVTDLLTKTFLKNNSIWSKYNLTKEQLDKFFQELLIQHLNSQQKAQVYMGKNTHINLVYVLKGKIVSVLLHYEMQQYRLKIKQSNKPPSIELFRRLQKYGKQLLKDIKLDHLEKGKHLYGNFGAADDQNIAPKFAIQLVIAYCTYLKGKGFKSMIARTSNLKANGLYQKIGGKTLKTIEFKEDGIIQPMALLYLDFDNPVFAQVLQKRSKRTSNQQISPKL